MGKKNEFIRVNGKNLAKKFFELSHCGDKKKRSQYFGQALGCLLGIYEGRSWWDRWGLFKNSKTGLNPVVKKIKDFVKSEKGYYGKTFLSLLKVLANSVLVGMEGTRDGKSAGILGDKEVFSAINEIKNTIKTSSNAKSENDAAPAIVENDLPSKEEDCVTPKEKSTVWGLLKKELHMKFGHEFGDNLVNQASEMLLGRVKEGIIYQYSLFRKKNPKVMRNFKKIYENLDKAEDEEKAEKQKSETDEACLTAKQAIINEAERLCNYQKTMIQYCKDYGRGYDEIDEYFDLHWVQNKIKSITKDIGEYKEILRAMPDAGFYGGKIIGRVRGLKEVVEFWKNQRLTIQNYEQCQQAVQEFLKSKNYLDAYKIIFDRFNRLEEICKRNNKEGETDGK